MTLLIGYILVKPIKLVILSDIKAALDPGFNRAINSIVHPLKDLRCTKQIINKVLVFNDMAVLQRTCGELETSV